MSCGKLFVVAGGLILLLLLHTASFAEGRREHLQPHGNYSLDYEVDTEASTIELWINTKATGWVGVGFNPLNGTMFGADLFQAYVNPDNTTVSGDFHGKYGSYPPLERDPDDLQNWDLQVEGTYETANETFVHVKRALDTGDVVNDVPIQNSTLFLVWSYRNDDNTGEVHHLSGNIPINLFTGVIGLP